MRLREIADVHDGIAEVRSLARLNGRTATTFGVFKAKGSSDVSVAKAVEAELGKIKTENPAVHMTTIFTTVDAHAAHLSFGDERADRGLGTGGGRSSGSFCATCAPP